MEITVRRMHVFNGEGKSKAAVDIDIAGFGTIYGCKLVQGDKGMFLSTPQQKDPKQEGKYWNIVFLEKDVLSKASEVAYLHYKNETGGSGEKPKSAEDIAWEE